MTTRTTQFFCDAVGNRTQEEDDIMPYAKTSCDRKRVVRPWLSLMCILSLIVTQFSCAPPMATKDQFDLAIWTTKKEYKPEEQIEINCRIDNLTGKRIRFDGVLDVGHFTRTKDESKFNALGWENSRTGQILLKTPSGEIRDIAVYGESIPAGMTIEDRVEYLPPGGVEVKCGYSQDWLDVAPGIYTLTLQVLGKSSTTSFTITEH